MKTEDKMLWSAFWVIVVCILATTNAAILIFEIMALVGIALGFKFMKGKEK